MPTYILKFMCVKMKVSCGKQVLKQGINIKPMCPNRILEFRNTFSHLVQVYLGAWANIEIVIENHVC